MLTAMINLSGKQAWIFDLDGTLTESVHDFDAIRLELGLPPGRSILESIEEIAAADPMGGQSLRASLDAIEQRYLGMARSRSAAAALLQALQERGARLGVLTRNTGEVARETLATVGLDGYFDYRDVLGRDDAIAKPSPAGIERLLSHWQLSAGDAVMVGDYIYDIEAGAAAGATTVCLDLRPGVPWSASADVSVPDLETLLALVTQ
ncbi:MAG: HAD superfamily hydrolase (TIGR01509 family) [Pseudohongiellaceae bacterium]|jgi:HAD superfamily hydrolase (TIGR01509 family)